MFKKNVFDIVKYCNEKKCEKAAYSKLKTSGNDPSISKAMRYSQLLKSSATGNVLYKVRVPDPPTKIKAEPGTSCAYVSWSPPDYYGGTKILYYLVFAYPNSDNLITTTQTSKSNTITFSGLSDGVSYKFSVTAVNTVGNSAGSSLSNATTPRTYPAIPVIIDIVNNGLQNQLLLTWSFIKDKSGIYDNNTPLFNGGANITSYTVRARNSNIIITVPIGQVNSIKDSKENIVAYNTTILGLTSGVFYSYKILATNEAGDSPYSNYSQTVQVL